MAEKRKKKQATLSRKELRKQEKLEKKARRQEHEAKRPRKQKPVQVQTASRFQFDDEEEEDVKPVRAEKKTVLPPPKFLAKRTKLEQELEEDEMEIRMLEQKLGIRKKEDWSRVSKEFRKDGFDDEVTRFLRGDEEEEEGGGDDDDDDEEEEERDEANERSDDDDDEEEEEEEFDPLAHAETTFLPKSGLYGEDVEAPLRKSLKRASKGDENGTEEDEALQNQLRSILNKLSSETASHCLKQVLELFESGTHAFQHALDALCQAVLALRNADEDLLLPSALIVGLDALLKGRNVLSTFLEEGAKLGPNASAGFFGNLCALEACFPKLCMDVLQSENVSERAALDLVQTCGWKMRGSNPALFRDLLLALSARFDTNNVLELHARSKFDYKPREDLVRQRKKWLQREVFLRFEHSRLPPPLQVSLEDFANAEHLGRWWIQGASWQQDGAGGARASKLLEKHAATSSDDALDACLQRHADLVPNAVRFGLKTKLKQAIFCAIMSSSDYLDAFANVMQLKLAPLEERVLCQLVVKLASETKTFNPFFALLAVQLCTFNSNFKFSFQVVIWDMLKELKAGKSYENFAKFVGEMIIKFALSLSLFIKVDFARLVNREMIGVLRECFVHVFTAPVEGREGDLIVAKAFSRLQNVQDGTRLRDGLVVFFARTEPFLNAKKSTLLGKRVAIAKRVLDHYVKDSFGGAAADVF